MEPPYLPFTPTLSPRLLATAILPNTVMCIKTVTCKCARWAARGRISFTKLSRPCLPRTRLTSRVMFRAGGKSPISLFWAAVIAAAEALAGRTILLQTLRVGTPFTWHAEWGPHIHRISLST